MGELECGQEAEILKVKTDSDSFTRRLVTLGLFTGAKVKCLFKSGGVSCFCICGAKIALRDVDLRNVEVVMEE